VSADPALAPRPRGSPGDWARPFDQLSVGESYVSKRRTVTGADVVTFAGLCGQPSPAGEPAAPSLLPLAYSIGLVPNDYIRALRRILDLELLAPARPGSTIHVQARIVRLDPWTDDFGLVTGSWRILDQRGAVLTAVRLEAVWVR
jgi:acyl dehydratase